jgi:hypothetical protein
MAMRWQSRNRQLLADRLVPQHGRDAIPRTERELLVKRTKSERRVREDTSTVDFA